MKRLLRLILRLFPRPFRTQYGDELIDVLLDKAERVRNRRGRIAVVGMWAFQCANLAWSAIMEWRTELARGVRPQTYGGGSRNSILQDLKGGLRGIIRNPGLSGAVIVTLAVAIGAGTSMFSVVNGVLFKPLSVPNQDRLLAVHTRFLPESGYDLDYFSLSVSEYFDYIDQNSTLSAVFAFDDDTYHLYADGEQATIIRVVAATSNMFDALGVRPLLGRNLTAEDAENARCDANWGSCAIVLSHAMWTNLGNDPDIVGRSLVIGRSPVEIVGVMPQGYGFPDVEVMAWATGLPGAVPTSTGWWTRGDITRESESLRRRGHNIQAYARMKDGVSIEDVRAELDVLMGNWQRDRPDHFTGHYIIVEPLINKYVGEVKTSMFLLLGAVGLVLLIACVNVAGVLLARGESRSQEFAVRHALGAGKQRLFRQLLVEYSILAVVGGGLGVALAYVGVPALMAIEGNGIPRVTEVEIDLRVLGFSLLATLLALGVFGIVPAFQATRANTADILREGTRHSSTGARLLFRRALISGEIALAVVISAAAGLMLSSVRALGSVDTGIDAGGRLGAFIELAGYWTPPAGLSFYTTLLDRLNSDPRVISATAANAIPYYAGDIRFAGFEIEGRAEGTVNGIPLSSGWNFVHDGFFETMGMRLVRGRLLGEDDLAGSELVTVINETMAEMFWPGEDPIGQRMSVPGGEGQMATIVGIVAGVHWNGLREDPPPMRYYRQVQAPQPFPNCCLQTHLRVAIHTNVDPVTYVPTLKAMVKELDADQPVQDIRTLQDGVARLTARDRFFSLLMGLFAAIAVVLGTVGIYGVMSHSVEQRRKEIGIRMALGAAPNQVAGSMIWQSLALTAIGVGLGVLGALAGGALLQSILFNVAPNDPTTLLSVVGLFGLVGVGSSLVPAVRAARINPVEVLRAE